MTGGWRIVLSRVDDLAIVIYGSILPKVKFHKLGVLHNGS